MAVIRDEDMIELICDTPKCGRSPMKAFERDKFEEMIDDAKKKGWQVVRDGKRYYHFCDRCVR